MPLILALTWLLFAQPAGLVHAQESETAAITGSGVLDGLTFSGELGPRDMPANVKDTLVFANGTFLSTECHKTCGYLAQPYFVRTIGDATEFISETRCPSKDATIVWRGTVEDNTIRGTFTWTVNRWYWTIEKEFWFKGALVEAAVPMASIP